MNLAQELERTLQDSAQRLGIELQGNLDDVRGYAAERMLHLSSIVDEPGYHEALVAETVNVALAAAGEAVDSADALDRELVGLVGGFLAAGARALATA